MLKNVLKVVSFLILMASIAIVVWYSPIIFKGYSALISRDSLLLARNYSKYGIYGIEDNLNIILATSLVSEKSKIDAQGNQLTPLAIGLIFKWFGLLQYEYLVLIPIILFTLALLLFALSVYFVFNFKTMILFSFVYILLPFNWHYGPYNFGAYEVGLLLFSLSLFFSVWRMKARFKYKNILLIFSGVFLALAGMARENFFVIVPVLFLFLFFKKQKKFLLYLFIPFLIIISLFWLPQLISGKNSYLDYFIGAVSQKRENFISWGYVSHFFPDPYTCHFNRQGYLEKFESGIDTTDIEFIDRIKMKKGLSEVGIKSPGLLERLKIGTTNLIRHLSRFAAIEDIGGPLILLLIILGFISLREKERYFYHFFVFWIIFTFLFLSYVIIASRTHLIDFSCVIALVVALGLIFLTDIFSQHFQLEKTGRFILLAFLSLLIFYNLILSSHVLWGRIYDEEKFLVASVYAQAVNQLNISDRDVIAVNIPGTEWAKLNYLTDKSMVVFAPETIEELIQEDKLQDAFDKFGVRYILGYSPELTEKILTNAKAENIASDDIDLTPPEVSQTKSWLMNLVR